MALNPLPDRRDEITLGDLVAAILLILILIVGAVDVVVSLDAASVEVETWRRRAEECEARR